MMQHEAWISLCSCDGLFVAKWRVDAVLTFVAPAVSLFCSPLFSSQRFAFTYDIQLAGQTKTHTIPCQRTDIKHSYIL